MEIVNTGSPEERAAILLHSLLTPEQRLRWVRDGYFTERIREGDRKGCLVIIQSNGCVFLQDGLQTTKSYCVHTRWWSSDIHEAFPPQLDDLITFLIWVRFDPVGWQKTANVL